MKRQFKHDAEWRSKQAAKVRRWRERHPDEWREYWKGWQAANREHTNALKRERRVANPVAAKVADRKDNLKRKFNLTMDQYEVLFSAQGGVCAICSRPPDVKRRLAVDHNHMTAVNRGLLCSACNLAVGLLEADPDWAEKAANYLARYIEQTVR